VNLDETPLLVFWESTRACRLACRHCRAEAIERPLPDELTTGEALAMIEQVAGFAERPPVLVVTGGDFLMRADVMELLAFARSLGMPVAVAPSVTPLLTGEVVDRLRQLGVKAVSISLDGATPATHDGIRGIEGHLAQTVDALRLLTREGFAVQVNTTVMRDNVDELADVAALLIGLGIPSWEVFFLVRTGRGTRVAELAPAENEHVAHFLYDASTYGLRVRTVEGPFFRRVATLRRVPPAGGDAAEAPPLGGLYRHLEQRLRHLAGPPRGPARAQTAGTRDGKGVVFISYRGDVYPSGFLPLAIGNVRSGSILDIYRHDPLLRRIRAGDFSGRCGRCEYRELCGGSRARAFAALGDPLGEDPACAYQPN
jgi:AdoMet-dependent heme synthase